MRRMKEFYAVPDRHIRYTATKAFFGTKMTKGSSVQSHGVKILSVVEKLEDLKAGLDNNTYIDVILQSLPPSYDPFIINYNMNRLEKFIHELINMSVQYEAMTQKSAPAVFVREASTSEVKGKRTGRWKRKKVKEKVITATASAKGAPAAASEKGKGKGKGNVGGSQWSNANDVCMHCQGKGHWKREYTQLLSNPGVGKEQKAKNAVVLLEKGFLADSQRDEVLLEESSELPQQNDTTSFEPSVPAVGVPVICKSIRESRPAERYGFVGLTSQLDNDPKTYREAMSDIDTDKWLEAMARLVAKGYTQRPKVDFEETYSPVAMAKSIRILLATTACRRVSLLFENNKKSVVSKGPSMASNKLSKAGTHNLMKSYRVMISSRTSMILVYARRIWVRLLTSSALRSRRMLGLTQSSYIENVMKRFKMENSKRGFLLTVWGWV
ncbi:hypothetical protein Sango_2868800 [Sesamum angolense]|uniref:Reverse transcriptase Ty1/copia-type domain-containing protein n=1 Tax=Sesamum angolense TaxID=2727404 RepID=A0AAE1T7A6_9LAMI|nr:hypothetical protein Sango_2868800 [Sesamum angolense]